QKSALELPPVTVGPLSLRLAAAKGDPSAEFEVGARLAEGKGTDQSFKDAVKWYTRSANQGFAQAQYRLGTLYERGLGVKSDPARARVWYSRAAEQGNVKAMHNLAVLSAGSKSGSPDYSAAAHWFGEAAVRGLGDSQFNLAVLYDSGLGVSKDTSLAYQWFALAARSGDKEAVRRRDLAKAALPATDAAAIDARVASWLPQSADQMANDARAAGEAWKRRENAEEGNG
ncbi:MAG: tetratricopeptide repeat protein, partial [Hyphomicrobium sp.]